MPSSSFSRRRFLGTSLKAGAGAAVLGLVGGTGEAWASAALSRSAAGISTPPPQPAMTRTYVSRPDFTVPGVSIVQSMDVAAIPDQPQYIFLTPRPDLNSPQPASTSGLMISDLSGELVWWQQMSDAAANPFNLRVQTFQGLSVLTYYAGEFAYGGTDYVLDGNYRTVATVQTDLYSGIDLHEFLITPTNTALCTSYEFNQGVTYGHALELGIPNSGSTAALLDWSSEGNVPTSLSYSDSVDYFHINSIDLWPGRDRNLLISSRNTWAVYLIDRKTLEIIWRAGGKDSSFKMGPGCDFEYAHDARPLADGSGFSLFDDASQDSDDPAAEKQSWGKVFSVDQDSMEVTLRHQFNHPDGHIDSPSQGSNQVLPTGGHFVGWGAVPYFTLFGSSGSAIVPPAILDGRLPNQMSSYRAFMNDWVGTPPTSEMGFVVHTGAGSGNFTAYLSWNGATEIDSWRINAGTSDHQVDLPTIKRKTKSTFETAIDFTRVGATWFQGVALDVNGAVLGRTAIIRAT